MQQRRIIRIASPLTLVLLLAACAGAPSPPPALLANSARPGGEIWHPAQGATFQLQFEDPIDPSLQADVYDLDLFDTDPSVVEGLHSDGKRVVCYISAGSWESWRPDADSFPPQVIGKKYEGWPGEKWLDIRQLEVLAPLMTARLDLCAAKGFDGVEPDNLDIWENDTGFPLTYSDQLAYALWLAGEARARSLAIGLKNAPDMAGEALPYFDFAVLEDCFEYGWCAEFIPFVEAGKPVFAIEYTDSGVDFAAACEEARSLGLAMILKNRSLDAFRQACP